MKHLKTLSTPRLATLPEGHPDLKASITGLLRDPIGVLQTHLDKDDNQAA